MKTQFNSDSNLLSKKTIELYNMIIFVRSIFHEGIKYYPQVFLDECLYKLQILEHDRIDVSEGINVNKTNGSLECIICYYRYFHEINFRFQPKVCNDCFNENHNHHYYKVFLKKYLYK